MLSVDYAHDLQMNFLLQSVFEFTLLCAKIEGNLNAFIDKGEPAMFTGYLTTANSRVRMFGLDRSGFATMLTS